MSTNPISLPVTLLDETIQNHALIKLSEITEYLDCLPDLPDYTPVYELSEMLCDSADTLHNSFICEVESFSENGITVVSKADILKQIARLTRPFELLAKITGDKDITERVNSIVNGLDSKVMELLRGGSDHE
ncbi:hypothetical protein [Maridesulfovibrio ferrireducens]|uniref:hypothetical protein n=1 Tax=Maridesulfovibrio ferrireducens TaxID=246191 RepID=UPI001A21E752|nr:hypothetical protein [Maridesulfovibrio ferrireducens]MBI9112265.1 hypothetical protein [Maridesulfovibrio ferrireducens]